MMELLEKDDKDRNLETTLTKYSLHCLKTMVIAHHILCCCEAPPLLGEVANSMLLILEYQPQPLTQLPTALKAKTMWNMVRVVFLTRHSQEASGSGGRSRSSSTGSLASNPSPDPAPSPPQQQILSDDQVFSVLTEVHGYCSPHPVVL